MRGNWIAALALGVGLAAADAGAQVAPSDSDVDVVVTRGDPGQTATVEGEVSKPEGDFEDVINYRVEGIPSGSQATQLRISVKCTGVATSSTKFFVGPTAIQKIGCNSNNKVLLETLMNANSKNTGAVRVRADSGAGSNSVPAYTKYKLSFTASPYRPN